MVKHCQAIPWLSATNRLSMFDHFVGLVLKWLTASSYVRSNLSDIDDFTNLRF